MIIDIGCGKNKTKGAVGIDISKESDADITADFDSGYIPLKSNIADTVVCQDILEHIEDTKKFSMKLSEFPDPQQF